MGHRRVRLRPRLPVLEAARHPWPMLIALLSPLPAATRTLPWASPAPSSKGHRPGERPDRRAGVAGNALYVYGRSETKSGTAAIRFSTGYPPRPQRTNASIELRIQVGAEARKLVNA